MGDAGREVREHLPSDAEGRLGGGDSPVKLHQHVADHYEVLGEIGRGGMGIIFRARDTLLQRDVALKCPWPRAADPVIRERFLREARSASQLSHPNVVPIYEVIPEWRGLPWLVMELVDGAALRSLLIAGRCFDIETILQTALGLAKALRAAHGNGIIHRDVNPNNILIRTKDDWPLLTDFGLAVDPSAHTVSEPLTAPGHVIGTAGYMSPEQVLGGRLDPRSDIFSLGTVLYEMCTRERAFKGDEPEVVNKAILEWEPIPICTLKPEVPKDLERLIQKAMAKAPARRHGDTSELVSEIEAAQGRFTSAQYRTTWTGPSRPPYRVAAWGAGIAVIALAAMAATRLPSLPTSRDESFPTGSPLQVTRDPGWEAEPAISPDGQSIAYTAAASETSDIWITDPTGGSRLRLTDDPAADHSPAWFPDGSTLAFVSDRGGEDAIWKAPRLGGSAVLLVPHAVDPAVSPDGKRIAFARRNAAGYSRIAVATVETPAQARTMTSDEDGRDHIQPAWSPDGRAICYTDRRNLWVVGADGGRPRPLTHQSATDLSPVWSADGRHVIFTSSREGTQALWRVPAAGGVAERLTIGTGPEGDASLTRDGARVVYSTYLNDYDIVLVDLEKGRRSLIETRLYESAPTFAPDGKAVAFASTRPGGRMDLSLHLVSEGRPSGQARQLTDLPGTVNTPAFSPDGRWIAFKRELEGRVGIWVTGASGGLPHRFTDDAVTARHPAWSPDGTALAYVVEGGAQAHVWVAPFREGRPSGAARQLTRGNTRDQGPDWSPDGRTIAYVSREERHDEIRVVPSTGGGPRLIARGTGVGRLRWEKGTGWLWFSATSPRGAAQLWKVHPDRRKPPVAAASDDMFAEAVAGGDFELSFDGRLLAYTRQQTRGDIWLVERRQGN